MWTKWEIVDELKETTTMERTCLAQLGGNNFVKASLRLKNVLWLCWQLEMAFLLEKMNYYQQTSKQSAKLHVVFFIIIRFCICYTNIKDRGLLQQKEKNNVCLKHFQHGILCFDIFKDSMVLLNTVICFHVIKPSQIWLLWTSFQPKKLIPNCGFCQFESSFVTSFLPCCQSLSETCLQQVQLADQGHSRKEALEFW